MDIAEYGFLAKQKGVLASYGVRKRAVSAGVAIIYRERGNIKYRAHAHLELKLAGHDGEFKLIKWMMGLLLGGVAALILKSFF